MHVPFRLGLTAVALVLLTVPARADTWPAGHEIGVRHYCGRSWVVEVEERPVYLLLPDPAHHQAGGTLPCA